MADQQAAARAERQSLDVVVLRRVFRRAIDHQTGRRRFADGQPADFSRRGDIRLDQRGRQSERAGDVVKAVGGVVGRQQRRHVDVEIEDVANDVGVFRPIQAMQAGRRGVRGGRPVKLALEPGDEAGVGGLVGTPCACGRHHAGPQLADDALPDLRVLAHVLDIKIVERDLARGLLPGRFGPLVVAADTIAIQERTLGGLLRPRGSHRWRLGRLRNRGLTAGNQGDCRGERRECHARDRQNTLRHRCVPPLG